MGRLSNDAKLQLKLFLARGGVGEELVAQLDSDDDRIDTLDDTVEALDTRVTTVEGRVSSVVLQTMDPDSRFDVGDAGEFWDTGGAIPSTTGVGQKLTLEEEITFNQMTLAMTVSVPASISAQVIVRIYELDGVTVGDQVAKSSRVILPGLSDNEGYHNDAMLVRFDFTTTTLEVGTYIIVVEAKNETVAVIVKTNGEYEGGEVFDVDLTDNNALTGWGSDPAYDVYLIMRYIP